MKVAFGGTWRACDDYIVAPCTKTLALGGLGRHTLALDVRLDGGDMMEFDGSRGDVM
jgi:hypothetical protein